MKITRYRLVEAEVPETLDGFKGWEFSSGSSTGEDFKVFSNLFKARVSKSLPKGTYLIKFNSNHYYLSGFIQMGNRFAYFYTSDVRHFPENWHKNILVRTAQSDTDYTGGTNGYTPLEGFADAIGNLLGAPKQLKL